MVTVEILSKDITSYEEAKKHIPAGVYRGIKTGTVILVRDWKGREYKFYWVGRLVSEKYISPKSFRYRIDVGYHKGKPFRVTLYDRIENRDIKSVTPYGVGSLYQYKLTLPQMRYLEMIEKMCKGK